MKIFLIILIILFSSFVFAGDEPVTEDYFFMGEYYLLQEDYPQAEKYFLLALEQDPGSLEIYNTLIDLSLENKDYEKALDYVLKASVNSPLDGKLIDLAINLYAYLDKLDLAYQFIDNKIHDNPGNTELLSKKITLLISEYRWDEVINLCADILLLEPDNMDIFQTMIEVGVQTEEYDALLAQLDSLMIMFPDNPAFTGSYIRILYSVGDEEQILNELWKLNERFPQNDIILNQLAQQLNTVGNFAQSDSIYLQLIKDGNSDGSAFNNYAYNLCTRKDFTKNDLTEALKYGGLALEKSPENASYLDTVGWIYYQMGDYDLAEHFLLQSLKINQENAIIFEHLSDVYVKKSRITKALDALDHAISIDNNNERLKDKRAHLTDEKEKR